MNLAINSSNYQNENNGYDYQAAVPVIEALEAMAASLLAQESTRALSNLSNNNYSERPMAREMGSALIAAQLRNQLDRQPSYSYPLVLRLGSRGEAVAEMQTKLAEQGFNPGPIDGIFGPMTRYALITFQRTRALTVDGIYGPQSKGALAGTALPTNGTGNAFIDSILNDALESKRATGVPASVTIAQAILESGWGKSGLTRMANNFFGIKGEGPAGHVTLPTKEYLNGQWVTIYSRFRKYHTPAESFIDHGQFFLQNSRYREAMNHTDDPYRFAREIQRAGYATAPNYADTLISIMRQYNLVRFDQN